MKRILYLAGRAFQVIGLIALPSSLWVGFLDHDEAASIGILVGSLLVFYLGVVLSRLSMR